MRRRGVVAGVAGGTTEGVRVAVRRVLITTTYICSIRCAAIGTSRTAERSATMCVR